jgi:hypothetical protein
MDCVLIPISNGFICQKCGKIKKKFCLRNCDVPDYPYIGVITQPTLIRGPGDYLHDAILKLVGEVPTRECSCRASIAKMNSWGPAGCRAHLDEIVEWMDVEAKQRGWWRFAVAVPGSRLFIKRMVLGAIKQAEVAASPTFPSPDP